MNPYFTTPFLIFLSLLQSTAWPRLQIGAVWPDVLLLVVMSWALLRGAGEGAGWAFVGGISIDLLSSGPFGASAVGLMVVVFIAASLRSGVFRGRAILPLVAAFAGTMAFHVVYLLGMLLVGQQVDWLDALLRIMLPMAIYNAVLSVFVFRLMSAIDRRVSPRAFEL